MTAYGELIPVNVITGFLGSGKTTLLARLLRSPSMADAAVLINEFGEVGLDHHLVQGMDESTILLSSGCICCTIRGDLQTSLRDLFSRRERGEVPPFQRVVVETTGLADPVPIAYTLLAEPVIQHHFRLGAIVTTVDAVNGNGHLDRYAESVKQVAVADRIVLTKSDLAAPAAVAALKERLRRLNPAATLLDNQTGDWDAETILQQDFYDEAGRAREIQQVFAAAAAAGSDSAHQASHFDGGSSHSDSIQAFCLTFEHPLDWTAFGIWMTMLLHRHGEQVLRMKGMLNMTGVPTPVIINGVQHIVHPPSHLNAWPDGEHRSKLIFIVEGLPRAEIERSFRVFNALSAAEGPAQPNPPKVGTDEPRQFDPEKA